VSAINPGTEFRQTNVKDFRKGLGQTSSTDREFLHQYMTLTKCDLYFADKAILVEGTTERILMPRLISIVDEKIGSEAKLAHQYITTIEIGGAYAQAFYPLIDFLELKTLIITDLDAVYLDTSGEKKKWKKCPCAKGARSSNAAINAWFSADNDKTKQGEKPSPSIQELIEKPEVEKLKGFRRIAYQVPEPGSNACARSFEDALVLANPKHFVVQGTDKAEGAWEMAQDMPKAETAIQFAMRQDEWNVPHYISEGLLWLSEPPPAPDEAPPLSGAQGDAS
jgi:hypothetical protein